MAMLFVAATMLTFASCNKDDDKTDSGASYPESVESTSWQWLNPDETAHLLGVSATFYPDQRVSVNHIIRDNNPDIYVGSYTYSAGQGTMTISLTTSHEEIGATFSVKGTTLILNMQGTTYTLQQK